MADRTPAVASGARSTVAGIVSTRLKVDMSDIYMYESESPTALHTTLSLLKKERAIAKTVSWHVDELVPKFARINNGAGYNDSATTFTVDTPGGSYVQSGFLIQVTRTGETMLTTTGGNATSIVVAARSWGATAAAALLDNDEILIIGPAYAENASLQSAITTTETQYSNYIWTTRRNWSMSALLQEIANAGGTYGGKDPEQQRRKMLSQHKRDMELGLLYSEGATSSGTATMTGLIPFIKTNAAANVNSATTWTEPVFEAGNEVWFRGGESDERILMTARQVHGLANQWAATVQRTTSGQSKYGLNTKVYTGAHGVVRFIRNTQLEGDEYSKYAVGFDPGKVCLKYVRDTSLIKDRQGVSTDGYEEEVVTDLSAVWGHPETCYLWDELIA